MQDRFGINLLLDYYGAFLTQTQREILRLSCDEDYSLSEIAEQRGITRQGVRDAIARGEKTLFDMEERLGIVERDKRALRLVNSAKEELDAACARFGGEGAAEFSKLVSIMSELSKIMEGNDGI